jgi:hypothetical protein
MAAKLKRLGKDGEAPKYKHVNVLEEDHIKLKEVALRENAKMGEVARFLIQLAYDGKVDFEDGE